MNRRTVLRGIGALAATPALPPLPVAAQAAGHSTTQVMWAAHYARVHKACSADMIGSAFGWSNDIAGSVFEQLVSDNVIRAPGLSGVAEAINPISYDFGWAKDSAKEVVETFSKHGEVSAKTELPNGEYLDEEEEPSEQIASDALDPQEDPEPPVSDCAEA